MNLFGHNDNSKDIARERLKLVIVHDRLNVSSQFLEMLKSEIIKVISNYMDIKYDELDIKLTRTKSDTNKGMVPALIANIPITKIKDAGK